MRSSGMNVYYDQNDTNTSDSNEMIPTLLKKKVHLV